ncbi:MAG: RNA 2',3'-cyclic phosphodiesterase [Candidatus Bathyarchaeia archaeon]|nr:RNA 2',3'-cyclic phosphodiesterase [Candidatus Bathyarchaeota archaeon]
MESIRSFIAFDIEDEGIIRELSRVQSVLLGTGADLKLVEPKNIHVTIRFLGEITPAMINKIYGEMVKVVFSPFDIEIRGLGAFPNMRHINVIWAGIRRGLNELRNIYYQLEPNLQRLGLRPDDKGFSPHLTIARVRTSRRRDELAKIIRDFENHEFGIVKARCLRLKKSILTPQGPIYSTLREVCR